MATMRPWQLRPWLIRAVIPQAQIGTYSLYKNGVVIYVGRSDTDLRRRLVEHALTHRADYFTYDVHRTVQHAFESECSLFHGWKGTLTNLIHPATPGYTEHTCPFCPHTIASVLANRIHLTATPHI
ncbi:hypothetical protein J2W54_000488 [Rhodococcus fascians]|uniref:hypothetical protein n=1 Tax=Nocardiaceae TaxID=85025 RepID=UPI0028571689|nr:MULTISPECIES: hypothetical protein [Rhodococcus]MDR6909061.1 hypothetical protein [Rhodococcus sp. 3258]MDR6930122.1 hypothetical protein [Rhodococcus fascians]